MSPRTARKRTSDRRRDGTENGQFEWLTLVEADGPFLSRPALKAAFRNGLAHPGRPLAGELRAALADWLGVHDAWLNGDVTDAACREARDEWLQFVLDEALGWKGRTSREVDLLERLTVRSPDGRSALAPTTALQSAGLRALLVVVDPIGRDGHGNDRTPRERGDDGWSASLMDRAVIMARQASEGVADEARPVVVVTDGRWWGIAWAGPNGVSSTGVLDATLFVDEEGLRNAWWTLLELHCIGVGVLSRVLLDSVSSAEEITEHLGSQIRQAVEMLVQAFSIEGRAADDRGEPSPLPDGPQEVYEAAVVVMMRIVFLLFAEERGLLPQSQLYRESYGFSTLADRLGARQREGQSRGQDAWHRLLAVSRTLYGGATFEDVRIPAYGGSLFDPRRFRWLAAEDGEGRLRLRIDDATMLAALRAIQQGPGGRISFRDLDVEQIGYAYEGLLGYTAQRAETTVLGLRARRGKDGDEPEVPLRVLEHIIDEHPDDPDEFAGALIDWIARDQPGAKPETAKQIARALDVDAETRTGISRGLNAVVRDGGLRSRILRFAGLLRTDLRGLPYVVRRGGLVVVESAARRNSGTHYTPRELAEEVVEHTLEPLVYEPGPLDTENREDWRLVSSSRILALRVADVACGSGAFLVAAARYLAARLVEARAREARERGEAGGSGPSIIEARREVICTCLYGADINPMAVEMCKLSLWLISLDRGKPFSFVDDRVFCGDALLGVTDVQQLKGVHIAPTLERLDNPGFTADVDGMLRDAVSLRQRLAQPIDEFDPGRSLKAKRQLMNRLDETVGQLRDIGDAIIAAGLRLDGKSGKALDDAYESLSLALLRAYPPDGGISDRQDLELIEESGLTPPAETGLPRRRPLHWAVEAPEVVIEHGGFDAIIGNPPFLGGKKITPAMGHDYRGWLVGQLAGGTKGNADYVAYFFLRVFALLRSGGRLGLIATNTIAQGDTREVGLDRMVAAGFAITRAVRSAPWPAKSANLEYAAVWGTKSPSHIGTRPIADGIVCARISTLLEPEGREAGAPARLKENKRIAFIGSYVLGKGFILSPEEAAEWVREEPRDEAVLAPYLNGDDLNSRPDCSASRWIIDFGERSEQAAKTYSLPWRRVHADVRPTRIVKDAEKYPRMVNEWWKYWNARPGLYAAIADLDEVLAIALVSKTVMPVRVPTGQVFSHALGVFATDSFVQQAVMSSDLHRYWAIKHGSTLETRVRYTPSDVFETFPLPSEVSELDEIGRRLDTSRREIMLRRQLGLTSLYNMVNDPALSGDDDADLLREIHEELDRRVADAYGWDDLDLGHGFYEYRGMTRWTVTPQTRVELLDRLLELNHERASAEAAASGGAKGADGNKKHGRTRRAGAHRVPGEELF